MMQFSPASLIILCISLNLLQIKGINAETSLDIPDDIVNDWDEAVIEQEKEQQYQREQRKASNNSFTVINKNLHTRRLEKKRRKPGTSKSYKSPLHKPILYQKIYIRDKKK